MSITINKRRKKSVVSGFFLRLWLPKLNLWIISISCCNRNVWTKVHSRLKKIVIIAVIVSV